MSFFFHIWNFCSAISPEEPRTPENKIVMNEPQEGENTTQSMITPPIQEPLPNEYFINTAQKCKEIIDNYLNSTFDDSIENKNFLFILQLLLFQKKHEQFVNIEFGNEVIVPQELEAEITSSLNDLSNWYRNFDKHFSGNNGIRSVFESLKKSSKESAQKSLDNYLYVLAQFECALDFVLRVSSLLYSKVKHIDYRSILSEEYIYNALKSMHANDQSLIPDIKYAMQYYSKLQDFLLEFSKSISETLTKILTHIKASNYQNSLTEEEIKQLELLIKRTNKNHKKITKQLGNSEIELRIKKLCGTKTSNDTQDTQEKNLQVRLNNYGIEDDQSPVKQDDISHQTPPQNHNRRKQQSVRTIIIDGYAYKATPCGSPTDESVSRLSVSLEGVRDEAECSSSNLIQKNTVENNNQQPTRNISNQNTTDSGEKAKNPIKWIGYGLILVICISICVNSVLLIFFFKKRKDVN